MKNNFIFGAYYGDELFKQYMEDQKEEIDKHKWIESEKVGYDLGEAAVIDWIKRFAASFREKWKKKKSVED